MELYSIEAHLHLKYLVQGLSSLLSGPKEMW